MGDYKSFWHHFIQKYEYNVNSNDITYSVSIE